MAIKQFSLEGIDLVAKMAAGVWGKEQGAHGSEVARIFCQHLTRYSLYSVDLAFQAEDEGGLQGIAPEFSTANEEYAYHIKIRGFFDFLRLLQIMMHQTCITERISQCSKSAASTRGRM